MPEIKKQLPAVTKSNQGFWDAARRHELAAYQCQNCGTYYAQPVTCIKCGAPRMEWVKVSGRGQVFTFCVYRQSFHPAWQNDIPYNVAYIQLDEGPLLMSSVAGCKNEDIYVGMPVAVTFEDITPEISLPKFKPVGK